MPKLREKGVFVCIEGLDCSGKTTQAKKLVKNLCERGFDAVYTTEPTFGKIGKLIRNFVLDRKDRVSVALEALLFAADRVDHVETIIEPLLKQDKIVVCDRYVYSSLAYQGAAGLDLGWIERINEFALKPNLALLIDVTPEIAVNRFKEKRSVMETAKNQRRVREVYLKLAQERGIVLIDGNRSIEDVERSILEIVLGFLGTGQKS
jgi:dTMP kinase